MAPGEYDRIMSVRDFGYESLIRKVEYQIAKTSNDLSDGICPNFDSYNYSIGYVRALRYVLSEIESIKNQEKN